MEMFRHLSSTLVLYYVLIINVATFLLYGIDKAKAVVRGWRIPESVLKLMGLAGGGLGGLGGMFVFRHKIRKSMFFAINLIGIGVGIKLLEAVGII